MKIIDIKSDILSQVELQELHIKGDTNHIKIIAVGKIFFGIKNVQKQQIIYRPLKKYILEKKIHSVSISAFTPSEWKKKNKFL